MAAERIAAVQGRQKMQAGADTMLVCAYDDDEKFRNNYLEGAISLSDFRGQLDEIPKDREIVFY